MLTEPVTAADVAHALPGIAALRDRCRALATLDAVMSPEWGDRYYSFDSRWGEGEEMASMRNGSGDEWSIVFSAAGAFIRGFDHESDMSPYADEDHRLWPGLVESVPEAFAQCVAEPAFSDDRSLLATVVLWRGRHDDRWHHGDVTFPGGEDPDGADWLFEVLVDDTPAAYQRFADEYYEVELDARAISEVLSLAPLTDELVESLNPDVDLETLATDLAAIGYPAASR